MSKYHITVTSDHTQIETSYEVVAESLDQAVNKLLPDIKYNISSMCCDGEWIDFEELA